MFYQVFIHTIIMNGLKKCVLDIQQFPHIHWHRITRQFLSFSAAWKSQLLCIWHWVSAETCWHARATLWLPSGKKVQDKIFYGPLFKKHRNLWGCTNIHVYVGTLPVHVQVAIIARFLRLPFLQRCSTCTCTCIWCPHAHVHCTCTCKACMPMVSVRL